MGGKRRGLATREAAVPFLPVVFGEVAMSSFYAQVLDVFNWLISRPLGTLGKPLDIVRRWSALLEQIAQEQEFTSRRMRKMAHSLDELIDIVKNEKSVVDSLVSLVHGLKDQLAEAIAKEGISPEAQAKIDGIFQAVTENVQEITDAIQTDGPAPTPAPAPVPTPAPEPAPEPAPAPAPADNG